jgi:hypothetical protein
VIKAYSHSVAEVYEDGIIQRRVVLSRKDTTNQRIRKEMLRRLNDQVAKAAARNPEKRFWIELKDR